MLSEDLSGVGWLPHLGLEARNVITEKGVTVRATTRLYTGEGTIAW
jgi:hypothetical protein